MQRAWLEGSSACFTWCGADTAAGHPSLLGGRIPLVPNKEDDRLYTTGLLYTKAVESTLLFLCPWLLTSVLLCEWCRCESTNGLPVE